MWYAEKVWASIVRVKSQLYGQHVALASQPVRWTSSHVHTGTTSKIFAAPTISNMISIRNPFCYELQNCVIYLSWWRIGNEVHKHFFRPSIWNRKYPHCVYAIQGRWWRAQYLGELCHNHFFRKTLQNLRAHSSSCKYPTTRGDTNGTSGLQLSWKEKKTRNAFRSATSTGCFTAKNKSLKPTFEIRPEFRQYAISDDCEGEKREWWWPHTRCGPDDHHPFPNWYLFLLKNINSIIKAFPELAPS